MLLRVADGYAWQFAPRPRPDLVAVDHDTSGMPPYVADAIETVVAAFRGRNPLRGYQSPWMGRGCFFPLRRSSASSCHYLIAKGVGPGLGSEAVRRMQEAAMRFWHGPHSGCLRLDTGTYYPLLVKYVCDHSSWHGIDPRPEGMSSFGNLLREVCAAHLLSELRPDVSSPRPLTLLRHRIDAPWGQSTRAAVEGYLVRRMPAAIDRDIGLDDPESSRDCRPPSSGRISPVFCHDLDGGLLLRMARSPYRVANLHAAAIDNDTHAVRALVAHLCGLFDTSEPAVAAERFSRRLVRVAAALFAEGIIHGQLHLHYHNISLAAEVADLDTMVFIRAGMSATASVPFAGSLRKAVYRHYWRRVEECSECWQIDLLARIASDARHRAGVDLQQVDPEVFAASMLRQIYDIYLHALRVVDLVRRFKSESLTSPGAILSIRQIAQHCTVFRRAFLEDIDTLESRRLYTWCLDHGYTYLQDAFLDNTGRPTLYGWSCPDVPIDHALALCDDVRQAYIRREVASLLRPNGAQRGE